MQYKVKIVDKWPGYAREYCGFWKRLTQNFDVVWSEEPDYLFYDVYEPFEHALDSRYDRCVKIFWTGENVVPDFRACDYAIAFEYSSDPRNLRWPLYVMYLDWLESLVRPKNLWVADSRVADPRVVDSRVVDPRVVDFRTPAVYGASAEDIRTYASAHAPASAPAIPAYNTHLTASARLLLASKTKFCNFVYSDPVPQERVKFFKLLSRYKRVDSGGDVENNLGYKVANKRKFISEYKFTIAFENSLRDGYVTEKIVEPLSVYSVPIYRGSSRITEEFNSGCFVNTHEFPNLEAVVDKVIELDQDDSLYARYLESPCFANNEPNIYCRLDYLTSFLAKIFNDRAPRSAKERRTCMVNSSWKAYL